MAVLEPYCCKARRPTDDEVASGRCGLSEVGALRVDAARTAETRDGLAGRRRDAERPAPGLRACSLRAPCLQRSAASRRPPWFAGRGAFPFYPFLPAAHLTRRVAGVPAGRLRRVWVG